MRSYGRLSDVQAETLRPHVEGKIVWDLGAGSGALSLALLELGVSRVVAVEKNTERPPWAEDSRILWIKSRFEELPKTFLPQKQVALVSWPENVANFGLVKLLEQFPRVAYLGSNTTGNACGWPGFFRRLADRGVLAYAPERKNALIVYGERTGEVRQLVGEEWVAMTIMSQKSPIDFADLKPKKTYPIPDEFKVPGREW